MVDAPLENQTDFVSSRGKADSPEVTLSVAQADLLEGSANRTAKGRRIMRHLFCQLSNFAPP